MHAILIRGHLFDLGRLVKASVDPAGKFVEVTLTMRARMEPKATVSIAVADADEAAKVLGEILDAINAMPRRQAN